MSWVLLFGGEITAAEDSLVKFLLEINLDEVGNFVLPEEDPVGGVVVTEVSKN